MDKHNITNNVPATTVNNTIIMTDEREWLGHLPLIEAPNNITNNLPTTITDNSTIIIADECVSEVDRHNITNNVPATTVNNTIIMTDEREWLGHLPLIEAPNNITNNLPTTITDNSTIIIADECVSEVDKHNITNNVPATTVNNTIIMTDEREWLGHLPLIEAPNNITNNLPTTITDNSTIMIADECVSEVDKHNITNNVPATTVNNTIIMTDEREWLGHLPLIEAPNPVP